MHTAYMSVREGVLVLLAQQPSHGYQLKADLERNTAADRALNVGQIYTTLERLQRDGLVEELRRSEGDVDDRDDEDAGRRRRYAVTEQGGAAARAWLVDVPTETAAGRDDVVTRVLLAVASGVADPIAVIDAQRRGLLERLQAKRRAARSAPDLITRLGSDAAAARLEATLAWLDRTEAAIRAADPNAGEAIGRGS